MPVIGNYIAGQILTAANLNASFAQAVNINGDSFNGTVTAPNLTATGTVYGNKIVANTTLTVQGVDVGSELAAAYNQANLAYSQASQSNPNTNFQQTQLAWNTANAASITANAALPTSGGTLSGSLTVNGTINSSNVVTCNNEIHASANALVYPGQVRLIQPTPSKGAIGVILRNDSGNFYILSTGNVTAGQVTTSTWNNNIRPFSFNVWTGSVTIDATGVGTTFGGNVSVSSLTATTANVAQIRSSTITGTNYTLQPQDSGSVLYCTNNSPITITVNNNLFSNYRIVVTQAGQGSVTFQAGSGVTINPRTGTLFQIISQYASASLIGVPYANNTYILDGAIQ